MLACVIHAAHDLRIDELPEPIPEPDELIVQLGAGGICGSDLHYYHEGRVADFKLREPLTLGHEVAGTVVAIGDKVTGLKLGDPVAVNPSRSCGECGPCRAGRRNHCTKVHFFGSASRFPHMQGGFAERFRAKAEQCIRLSGTVPFPVIACAEPLAVCLHAAKQAGNLLWKRVLITGAGPIGALLATVARLGGAARIVITDLFAAPLALARQLGADQTINVTEQPDGLAELVAKEGAFEVAFEAAGVAPALGSCIESLGPCGRLVQVGMLAAGNVPLGKLLAREIELVGTFRFDREFSQAVRLLEENRVDVRPLITAKVPLRDAVGAFDLASDRNKSLKVSLVGEG
jgi:L-idonate 5-dehydrogenase